MRRQSDYEQKQIVMEYKAHPEMPKQSCPTTMYVFGALVILGMATQIFLQSKMIKELRKLSKKR